MIHFQCFISLSHNIGMFSLQADQLNRKMLMKFHGLSCLTAHLVFKTLHLPSPDISLQILWSDSKSQKHISHLLLDLSALASAQYLVKRLLWKYEMATSYHWSSLLSTVCSGSCLLSIQLEVLGTDAVRFWIQGRCSTAEPCPGPGHGSKEVTHKIICVQVFLLQTCSGHRKIMLWPWLLPLTLTEATVQW